MKIIKKNEIEFVSGGIQFALLASGVGGVIGSFGGDLVGLSPDELISFPSGASTISGSSLGGAVGIFIGLYTFGICSIISNKAYLRSALISGIFGGAGGIAVAAQSKKLVNRHSS